ncbi:MAG: PRC-barrel domain-containing protein, partial [Microcystis sp.]
MITENSRLRSEFLNTQVITRNTGKKLGVVKDILVDIDQREVVALGLRDNILSLSGMPQYMYLSSISQTGDVVLVEDDNVLESVDI